MRLSAKSLMPLSFSYLQECAIASYPPSVYSEDFVNFKMYASILTSEQINNTLLPTSTAPNLWKERARFSFVLIYCKDMASPQIENGHIKIANEIFEAFGRIRISGEARQVLDVILRKTYGFNKKNDAISLSQFCLATGLKKQHVDRGITHLIGMNLITKKGDTIANVYSFNKDFDTWKPLPKKVTYPKKVTGVTKKDNNRTQKRGIQKTVTKDTITKDISTKVDRETKVSYGNEDVNFLISLLKEKNHGLIDGSDKENRRDCWNLLRSLGYKDNPQKAKNGVRVIIEFAVASDFHSKNATSFRYLYRHKGAIVADYKNKQRPKIEITTI